MLHLLKKKTFCSCYCLRLTEFCKRRIGMNWTTIGVRAGGRGGGAAAPPKVWATQTFWAARGNLGKASF